MITNESIRLLCEDFYSHGKLGIEYAIIFVYNDTDNADDLHRTECISPIEYQMIMWFVIAKTYMHYSFCICICCLKSSQFNSNSLNHSESYEESPRSFFALSSWIASYSSLIL